MRSGGSTAEARLARPLWTFSQESEREHRIRMETDSSNSHIGEASDDPASYQREDPP
jgi:hypothetical protein